MSILPSKSDKVLILGGSGFVGRSLCNEAILLGYDVTSLSRTGKPIKINKNLEKVHWERGDALDDNVMNEIIKNKKYIIHAMGKYNQPTDQIGELILKASFAETDHYNLSTRDSVGTMLKAIEKDKNSIECIGYLSNDKNGLFWGIRSYLCMKKEAEYLLLHSKSGVRTVIARPGYLYCKERRLSSLYSWSARFGNILTFGMIKWPPIKVDNFSKAFLLEIARPPKYPHTILKANEIYRMISGF